MSECGTDQGVIIWNPERGRKRGEEEDKSCKDGEGLKANGHLYDYY